VHKHGLSAILDSNGEPKSLSEYDLKKWRKTRASKILKESQHLSKGIKDEYLDDVHKLFLDPTLEDDPAKETVPVQQKRKKVVIPTESGVVPHSKPTYSFESGDYDRQYIPRIRRNNSTT
jgi:hypothetical protein